MRKLTLSIVLSCLCAVTAWGFLAAKLEAQSMYPFVPPDFTVPEKLETERFLLRMLTVNDVV